MTIDAGETCTEAVGSSDRFVRDENARLREMLRRAEQIAARYTIMLREGNHRIKNSLQIVSSLMGLQAAREETESARHALHTAAARIQAIGRMHDALQDSGGEDAVNLGAVVEEMCDSLHEMAGDPNGVTVYVDAQPIMAPIDFVQSVVLAINELVVNALRHAFPDGRTGAINVSLRSAGGQLRIVVADNGVGMPEPSVEGREYGMKLVRMMTEKVGATLYVDTGAGTRVILVMPEAPELEKMPLEAPSAISPVCVMKPGGANGSKRPAPSRFWSRKPWNAEGRG